MFTSALDWPPRPGVSRRCPLPLLACRKLPPGAGRPRIAPTIVWPGTRECSLPLFNGDVVVQGRPGVNLARPVDAGGGLHDFLVIGDSPRHTPQGTQATLSD